MPEKVALIHGFSATPATWDAVLPALEAQHDVHLVGLLGHHGTDPWPDDLEVSLDAIVDGAERSLDDAGLDTAHLVGNSLGGWVALQLAARGRARSVVALSPAGGWHPGDPAQRKIEALFRRQHKVGTFALRNLTGLMRRPRFRKLAFRDVVVNGDRIPPAVAVDMLRSSVECPIYFEFLDSVQRTPFGDLAGEIDCPVLIAWGTKDRILPYATTTERLRALVPQARWRELPNQGHMPQWDDPEGTARLILDEIAAATPAPASAGQAPSAAPTSA
jgi:pimeloyl-ACP methyl ester carboxylesterase